MAIQPVPSYTPVPTPLIQRGDRATFSSRVDTFIVWLQGAPVQFKALADVTYNNATEALGSATAAASSAAAAAGSATAAGTSATNSANSATASATSATNAATSATNAQNYADTLSATSTSSVIIGTGAKSFTTQAGKQFKVGSSLRFVSSSNVNNWMVGTVDSYSGTALAVTITDIAPSASGQTVTNWIITISGPRGATGAAGGITGANLTGALNFAQANTVPVSASPDIWSGAGNLVPLSGTGTITSFPNAPQVGAERTLVANGNISLIASANMLVYGGNVDVVGGDLIDVICEGAVNKFRIVVRRRDGTPVVHDRGALHNLRVFETSGMFTATKTGWHKITCIGASGSAATAAVASGSAVGATGAGAGGLAVGMRYLTSGVTYMANVGTGPTGPGSAQTGLINGTAGGATVFSGTGIVSMTANGGGGGNASSTAGASVAGGVGGTATGGDLNVKGGDGGSIAALVAGCNMATGGGAVGLHGSPFSGGAITATTGSIRATGGAGVGGNGGVSDTATSTTAGGGSGGAAIGNTGGANYKGVAGGAAAIAGSNELGRATGGGTNTGASAVPGDGGGSSSLTGYRGGMFAGSGGLVSTSTSTVTGGAGGPFGGAPGGVSVVSASGLALAGAASSGGIWIEF